METYAIPNPPRILWWTSTRSPFSRFLPLLWIMRAGNYQAGPSSINKHIQMVTYGAKLMTDGIEMKGNAMRQTFHWNVTSALRRLHLWKTSIIIIILIIWLKGSLARKNLVQVSLIRNLISKYACKQKKGRSFVHTVSRIYHPAI